MSLPKYRHKKSILNNSVDKDGRDTLTLEAKLSWVQVQKSRPIIVILLKILPGDSPPLLL